MERYEGPDAGSAKEATLDSVVEGLRDELDRRTAAAAPACTTACGPRIGCAPLCLTRWIMLCLTRSDALSDAVDHVRHMSRYY